jgi:hypothetical protein
MANIDRLNCTNTTTKFNQFYSAKYCLRLATIRHSGGELIQIEPLFLKFPCSAQGAKHLLIGRLAHHR